MASYGYLNLFYIICIIGCSYQIYDMVSTYMMYKTNTQIHMSMPVEISFPYMTLCVPYDTVTDLTKFKKKGLKSEIGLKILGNLTIAQIFEFSPETNNLFKTCRIRSTDGVNFNSYNQADCSKLIKINRFYTQ